MGMEHQSRLIELTEGDRRVYAELAGFLPDEIIERPHARLARG